MHHIDGLDIKHIGTLSVYSNKFRKVSSEEIKEILEDLKEFKPLSKNVDSLIELVQTNKTYLNEFNSIYTDRVIPATYKNEIAKRIYSDLYKVYVDVVRTINHYCYDFAIAYESDYYVDEHFRYGVAEPTIRSLYEDYIISKDDVLKYCLKENILQALNIPENLNKGVERTNNRLKVTYSFKTHGSWSFHKITLPAYSYQKYLKAVKDWEQAKIEWREQTILKYEKEYKAKLNTRRAELSKAERVLKGLQTLQMIFIQYIAQAFVSDKRWSCEYVNDLNKLAKDMDNSLIVIAKLYNTRFTDPVEKDMLTIWENVGYLYGKDYKIQYYRQKLAA